MKVLLLFPEMPSSYLNLDQLFRLDGRKALAPPVGLITVAALLPSAWQVRLVDLNTTELTALDWNWADLVMISALNVQRQSMLDIIQEAKQRGKTVVTGGPYPTSMPEEVLAAGSDFLIQGEAENLMTHFLQAWQEGRKGGIFTSEVKPDISTTPVPRYDLLNLQDYAMLGVQTTRGCPHNCEFCDVVKLNGRRPRHKKVDQVLEELSTIFQLGWRRDLCFSDDNFIADKSYTQTLLQRLILWMKSHGEPFNFWTQVSVDLGQNLPLIDMMTEANFCNIIIGIESPDPKVLATSHKYHNIRHSLVKSINNIKANGLGIIGSFILGLDGEKPKTGDAIRTFIELTDIPLVLLNILQPLPGTRLWHRLHQEGRLKEDLLQDKTFNFEMHAKKFGYIPSRPEVQIIEEYLMLWDHLFEPSRFLARAYSYYLAMRPTRLAMALRDGKPIPAGYVPQSVSLKNQLQDIIRLLRQSWLHGIRASYRWQYWRQLLGMLRNNRSRTVAYLKCCAMGQDMLRMRLRMLEDRSD